MVCRIGETLPQLYVYEALFPQHETVVQALSAIYCDLLQFCYEAKKVLRKPKRSVFTTAWKSFERQFGHMLRQFEKHEISIEKAVQTSHMIEAAQSRELARADQLQMTKDRKSWFSLRLRS